MRKKLSFVIITAIASISTNMYAKSASEITTWEKSAKASYDKRGVSAKHTDAAITQYTNLLNAATDMDFKVRAVEQLGRLTEYKAKAYTPNAAAKARLYAKCWCTKRENIVNSFLLPTAVALKGNSKCIRAGFVGAIASTNKSAYHYTKLLCMARWGESTGNKAVVFAFRNLLKKTMKNATSVAQSYEGGGIGRVVAGIRSNAKAKAIGEYDLVDARTRINESKKYDVEKAYYENQFVDANILEVEGKKDQAKRVRKRIVSKIEEAIDEEELERAPENILILKAVKKQL